MFTWDENYSIGHKTIDMQHKKLFDIGSKLEILIVNYQDSESHDLILEVYDLLLDYVKYHFETEENLLKTINYSNYDNHILKHKYFVDKLESINFSFGKENFGAYLFEMLQLVANWIFQHIKGDDFAYKYELENFVK